MYFNDQAYKVYVWGVVGLCPYQTVVLWYPEAGTIIAVMIVAILNVGHWDMN
jgi:hypothetical protein